MTIQIASEKTLLRHSQIVEIRRERIEKKGLKMKKTILVYPTFYLKVIKPRFTFPLET